MTAPYPEHPPQRGPADRSKRRISAGQILGIVLLVVLLVFIVENTVEVQVRLIVPRVRVPLYVALIIAGVLGALATLLIQYRRRRAKS